MEKMQRSMMKRYKMFAALGFIIVAVAFIISFAAADANATFFSVDKATREAATPGTNIVAANVLRQVIPHWVPALKFVGLGLLPGAPEKPRSAKMFPLLMMMGWMVLLIGLIWALATNSTVTAYWTNSIAATLNPAQAGSVELNQLGLIQGVKPWLAALRYLGMALLFSGITVALTVIIRTLQHQEKSLRNFVKARMAAA